MSDATKDEEEDLRDRKLYAVANAFVGACRAMNMSPADATVVLATGIGIVIARSNNDWTEAALEVMGEIMKSTFDIEREMANERTVPNQH